MIAARLGRQELLRVPGNMPHRRAWGTPVLRKLTASEGARSPLTRPTRAL